MILKKKLGTGKEGIAAKTALSYKVIEDWLGLPMNHRTMPSQWNQKTSEPEDQWTRAPAKDRWWKK